METRQPPEPAELLPLIAGEQADGAVFRRLARVLEGRRGEMAQRLAREALSRERCLRGMYTLMTGQPPQAGAAEPPAEQPLIALCRCYGRQLGRLSAYRARVEDPEYGPAFARMVREGQTRCAELLELIGQL